MPYGFGPGLKLGVIRVWVVNSPRKSSGANALPALEDRLGGQHDLAHPGDRT